MAKKNKLWKMQGRKEKMKERKKEKCVLERGKKRERKYSNPLEYDVTRAVNVRVADAHTHCVP